MPGQERHSYLFLERYCLVLDILNFFFFLPLAHPHAPHVHAGYLANAAGLTLTIIITLTLSLLYRPLPVRLGGSIVNLSEFYSYRLIGKLTAFLQLQEFSQCNQTWDHSSTFDTHLFLRYSNHSSHRSSLNPCHYVLILT
jgi:hypothetical protein